MAMVRKSSACGKVAAKARLTRETVCKRRSQATCLRAGWVGQAPGIRSSMRLLGWSLLALALFNSEAGAEIVQPIVVSVLDLPA